MNFSSLLGISIGITVMYKALTLTSPDLGFFMDYHGILIVCGGTLAAAGISFPIIDILKLVRVFFVRIIFGHTVDFEQTITDLLELNKKSGIGGTAISEMLPALKNDFLRESVSLVVTGVLTEPELRATLEQRLKTVETRYMQEANMFRIIGKFPPAFGLLATTLGMIGLLQKIGQPDSQKLIGPAMSVGLIGTLWGIAMANLIFIPIAENLTERTHEEIALRRLILEGVVLLKQQANPITMRERLNSYLLPKQRVTKKPTAG
ncbi:MAG: MotA/TolQ/ExbB proton channel family protein [Bdellovibrio sp.]|nr:MotA/TolQ/ExbB proton channel family protein [Bdellovibrio sp.]